MAGGKSLPAVCIEPHRQIRQHDQQIAGDGRDQSESPCPDDERIEPDDFLIAMGEPTQLRRLEQTASSS